jgi:hypothetical protein
MKTFDYPARCAFCQHAVEAASAVDGQQAPAPGDITLCIQCGEWNIFTRRGRLRKPTGDEYVGIVANPTTSKLRMAWLMMKAQNADRPN